MATPESNRQRSVWPTLVLITIITLLGGLVRWLIAGNDPMWLDELHTSWVVSGELGDVYQRAQIGNQTPLYFWLVWAATTVFGESEFSLRLISLIAGTATIFAAGWIVFRWTGSTVAAATTSVLIAFDARFNMQFIYHATEARPYALVQFLSVVQVALFWRIFFHKDNHVDKTLEANSNEDADQPKPAWALLFILPLVTALLFHVHYTSAWLFIAQGCFTAILLLDTAFRRRHLKKILSLIGMTALLLLPALPQLSQLVGRRSNWASVSSAREMLLQQALPLGCWVLAPMAALGIALLFRPPIPGTTNVTATNHAAKLKQTTDRIRLVCFVLLWAILPTIFVVMLDSFKLAPLALVRYTLVGSIAMPVFAGLVIGAANHPRMRTVLAIALTALTLSLSPVTAGKFVSSGFNAAELPVLRFEDWLTPINEINSNQAKKNQPVFLASNLIEDVEAFDDSDALFQEYLRFPVNGIHSIENQKLRKELGKDENKIFGREIIAIPTLPAEHFRQSDIKKIRASGGAWLIVRWTQEMAIEIEDEIVNKSAALYPADPRLKATRFAVPGSDVYLISFD